MPNQVKVISPCKPYLKPHLHKAAKNEKDKTWECMTDEERQNWVKQQAEKVLEVKTS